MTPLILRILGINHDSLMHVRACSTQGTVSPKELARPEEGPTGLFLAEWTAIRPQAVSNCQGNPTRVHQLEQPAGLPPQLQGDKKPLHAWLHVRTGYNKSEPMRLLREASGELKGNYPMVDPAKVWRTPKHVRSMGARTDRARGKENSWIRNRTFRANSFVIAKVLE